ncbi:MAG: hypothetical protein JO002_05770, partial [Burkholderiaceae bacterium]|nr:hypothetical protein [Burkholderiaceae bacterium]
MNRHPKALALLGFLFAIGIFFRLQIFNGFSFLFADRYDGFIEVALLEHWYAVLRGLQHWSDTNYFFNYKHNLALNDGYFLYGMIHSAFRAIGFDPLLSSELVNLVVRSVGYWSFLAACRQFLNLPMVWAVFAAILFTISNGAFEHMLHQQLLMASFAPLLALLLRRAVLALGEEARRPFLAWGAASVLLMAVWLMTAFYMAWFSIFFGLAFTGLWLIFHPPALRLRRHGWSIAALLLLFVVADLPFFHLYLPKAAETGQHSYQEGMVFSPALTDLVNVGDGNLFYGVPNAWIRTHIQPQQPAFSEQMTGYPYGIFAIFLLALLWLWRRPEHKVARILALSSVVTWGLLAHFGPFTAYSIVYGLIPGAKAVRVLSRYQLFLAGPLIAVTVFYLSRLQLKRPLLLVLCAFLVAEEINTTGIVFIDHRGEMARLAAIGKPPAECKSFYAANARPGHYGPPLVDGLYSHTTDAMMVAAYYNLPTINGMATFNPPNYDLFN